MSLNDFSLKGRVCLVTGASRALGASIARMLSGRGADVAVNYNQSAGAAADLCEELRALGSRAEPFHADVGDAEQASRMVADVWERFGRIDVLVNNAGPYVDDPYLAVGRGRLRPHNGGECALHLCGDGGGGRSHEASWWWVRGEHSRYERFREHP